MMKKLYLLLLSLLMTFTLTGCNQQVEKASSKQSVTLSLEQTSSQDVDVYVDQDQIDTLKSQGAGTYELKLTKGNHELKVVQDGEETQKSFYVDSKETLHYQITNIENQLQIETDQVSFDENNVQDILNKIEEYECICLYRHVNPDYDAFGSQFGMYDLIQNTFENKEVYFAGDFSSDLVAKYQFNGEINEPNFEKPTLGIVLDTANQERIDGDISLCKEIIKIDHHIVVDSYGNLNLEDSTASSCSQIVALFLKNKRVKLSSFGAAALYMGIIGDTNRFMYSATDERTFEAAMYLYNYDFDMQALYERMYMKHVKDLKVNAFILNHYIEDEGVAYYVLKDEDLKHLNISRERGSDFVNLLSSVDEYKVWLAITENTKDHNWRVSMRSRHIPVNEIANKYRGGGHAFASGATLLSLDELPLLLNDIKERINE